MPLDPEGLMNVIVVNGVRIELPDGATNVSISGDAVTVGGVKVAGSLSGIVEVVWEGPLASLESRNAVTVKGDVYGDARAGTALKCGNVGGDATAGTGLTCGDVAGSAKAGTGMTCGNIGGNANAGTGIKQQRRDPA
jgi:hypothetical protein